MGLLDGRGDVLDARLVGARPSALLSQLRLIKEFSGANFNVRPNGAKRNLFW
jgi:hypothetical protein